MFDDIKDRIARLSVARLQKRIDTLKGQQEMLNTFTEQRFVALWVEKSSGISTLFFAICRPHSKVYRDR